MNKEKNILYCICYSLDKTYVESPYDHSGGFI